MSKLVANGMFNVTAAAEKGAKPQFVYWDECPSSFKFCAGKDGEEVYHIVYNTRNTASSKYSKIPYLCIVSHTKNSTYPSDDVANSVNPKWMNFQTMALFATDLMLARKILAEEIDVDSLTVRNVSAVSSDGKTTCTIDGDTGKLTAKNADFQGKVTSNEGSIGGFEIADNRLGYNPFPSVLDGTPYVNMTKSEFNAWSEYFNPSDGGAVSKSSTLTAGYIETKITDSRTGYYQEHVACKFIAGNYGLKVTNTGIYTTSDGGNTWSLFGVS